MICYIQRYGIQRWFFFCISEWVELMNLWLKDKALMKVSSRWSKGPYSSEFFTLIQSFPPFLWEPSRSLFRNGRYTTPASFKHSSFVRAFQNSHGKIKIKYRFILEQEFLKLLACISIFLKTFLHIYSVCLYILSLTPSNQKDCHQRSRPLC